MLELGGLLVLGLTVMLVLAVGIGLVALVFKLLLWIVLLPLRLLGLIVAAVGTVVAVVFKGALLFVAAIAAILLVAIPLLPVLVAGLLVVVLFRSLRRRPTYAAAR